MLHCSTYHIAPNIALNILVKSSPCPKLSLDMHLPTGSLTFPLAHEHIRSFSHLCCCYTFPYVLQTASFMLALLSFMFRLPHGTLVGMPSGSSVCLPEQLAQLLAQRGGSVNVELLWRSCLKMSSWFLPLMPTSPLSEFPSCSLVFCVWAG